MTHDSTLTSYFKSIPALTKDEIKAAIQQFEVAKDHVLHKIADTPKAISFIIKECRQNLKDELPLSNLICDCEDPKKVEKEESDDLLSEDDPEAPLEHAPSKSISMKSTRNRFEEQISELEELTEPPAIYEALYHLKFKTNFLHKILNHCNLTQDSMMYAHARDKMITSNLRLVIHTVKKYLNKGIDFSDLIQEGSIGLIAAVDKYDYRRKRDSRFGTMAVYWIRLHVSRTVMNKSKAVRTPIHVHNFINKLNKALRGLTVELHRAPTPSELAEKLGWPIEKVHKTIMISQNPPYIINDNNHFDSEDKTSFINSIPDPRNHEDESIKRLDLHTIKQKIEAIFTELTPRQEKVIRLRYGFTTPEGHAHLDNDLMPQSTVAEIENLSKNRVRQLEDKVLAKCIKKKTELAELWADL